MHNFNKKIARFFNVSNWGVQTTGFPTILLPTIGPADIRDFRIPQLNGYNTHTKKKGGNHLNVELHTESRHLNLKYTLPATGLKRRSFVFSSCSSLYFDIFFIIIIFNFVRVLCVASPISTYPNAEIFENCFLLFF